MKLIYLLLLIFCCTGTMQAQVPANDLCVNAITLSCGGSVTGNTLNATNDAVPSPACAGASTTYGVTKSVWYKITPSASGTILLNTCTGTFWDTYLRVFEGNCGAFTICKGFSDDDCGAQSSVEFSVTANTTYYILLGGYDDDDFGSFTLTATCTSNCIPPGVVWATNIGSSTATVNWSASGNVVLEYGPAGFTPGTGAAAGTAGTIVNTAASTYNITALAASTSYDVYIRRNCGSGVYSNNSVKTSFTTTPPPPANDNCSGAFAFSTTPLAASSAGATQSLAPIICGGFQASTAKDVWFKFTASSSNTTVTISNCQASFDAILQAYSGTCAGTLTSLGCADQNGNGSGETLNLSGLLVGSVYYVRVYDYLSSTGNFSIAICTGFTLLGSDFPDFCNTDTVTLSGSAQFSNYQWYFNDVLLPGESQPALITGNPGNYYATASFGTCNVTSQTLTLAPPMQTPSLGGNGIYLPGDAVSVGIPLTQETQTYTWKKNGSTVYGPINGNGSNQSLNFNMTAARAGTYMVESNRTGCTPTYSGNVFVGYGGVEQLTISYISCSSVSFYWNNYMNTVQRFQYAVTQSSSPPTSGTVTSLNDAEVSSLQPGTAYYLHVRGSRIPFLSIDLLTYSDQWVTIAFTTAAAPPFSISSSAQNFCEGTNSITLTANVTGTDFKWYMNGTQIPNENSPSYQATMDGSYYATALVNNCVSTSDIFVINTQTAATPFVLSGEGVYAENAVIEFEIDDTESGTTYRLFKEGSTQAFNPPVNGNGTNQSINISMSSSLVAGEYYVQAERSGFCSSTSSDMYVYFGGVNNLRLDNCPFNSVQFSWTNYYNPVQRFRYIINNSIYPVGDEDTTELTSVTINNLLPNTQYYIHVSGSTIPDLDLSQIVYSDTWKTISFKTAQQQVNAGYCEWRGLVNGDWNNSANWACGIMPQSGSQVLIPFPSANYPSILQSVQLKGLTVATGAHVTVASGATVNIVP